MDMKSWNHLEKIIEAVISKFTLWARVPSSECPILNSQLPKHLSACLLLRPTGTWIPLPQRDGNGVGVWMEGEAFA